MSSANNPGSPDDGPQSCPFPHGQGSDEGGKSPAALTGTTTPRTLRRVRGPKPMPVLGWRGNLLSYVRNPAKYIEDLRKGWGNVAALVDGGNDPILFRPVPGRQGYTVFGFGSEINREVLTQLEVFGGGEFRAPEGAAWINSNMSGVSEERRVQQKAVISPAFTRDHLKSYFLEMVEEVDRMLASWEDRPQIDLLAESYSLAVRIASRCFYGQAADQIGENLATTIRSFAGALFHPMSAIRLKIPGSPYWRISRLSDKIRRLLGEELKRKEESGYSGNDVLSMTMRAQFDAKVRLSEDEVIGTAVGLFLAGHDVPANALVFMVSLLATHPSASQALMEEIDSEVGDGLITYEQIFRLPELDRVFQESLRILNPAFLVFRQAHQDTSLGDCEIPRGSEILLSPFLTSRDAAAFEMPGHFLPERWKEKKPGPFEYLPFSYGPRRCLGASFAEIQLKLIICRIFQRFRLVPRPDATMNLKYTFAVSPHGRLSFDLKKQDRKFGEGSRRIAGDFSHFVESAAS